MVYWASGANSSLTAIGPLQSGDILFMDMKQGANAGSSSNTGGFLFQLDGQNWAPSDGANVYSHVAQGTAGRWQHRSFAIGQQAAGHTLTALGINMQNDTPTGDWEIDYGPMVLRRADGTLFTIPWGADGLSPSPQNVCGSSNTTGQNMNLAVDATEGTTYFLDDHLGTTQIELAAGGWPLWQGDFTPFGQEIINNQTTNSIIPQPSDGTSMRFKFTGKERDAESGLDYFGARYYASSMGRWVSPDWSAKEEPVPYAKLDDPQSLNLYGYVGNNPLSKADPDGHEPTIATLILAGASVEGFWFISDWLMLEQSWWLPITT